jgi:beta-lactam-binding protein with PASTA domain
MKSYYKIEISKVKFWLLLLPTLLLFTGLIGGGAYLIIDKMVMPGVTGMTNRGEVIVPNITDLTLDSARTVCYDRGLRITVSSSEYSDSCAADVILDQEPVEGELVRDGRHISVITSMGSEISTIPDVSGLMEGPAKSQLRSAGFSNISVRNMYSSYTDQNMSINTEPESGITTSREAEIILYLSRGPRPTHTVVPNLVGDRLSAAQAALSAAGLQCGSVTYESSSLMGPGQVISQSSASGSRVSLDTRVNLVVSAQ